MMSGDQGSSWPGLLLMNDQGQLRICDDLLGKHFFDFVPHGGNVLVSCRDGCRIVSPSCEVKTYCTNSFVKISAGSTFFVGVTPEGQLYSWGIDATLGQLGQGVSKKESTDPSPIKFNASFVDIQSGEAFSMATDKLGNAYGFGENYSRQLGLYTKSKGKMHLQNALIEEMVFVPRLLPFSMQHPLRKISCGLHFVMAVSNDGKVFSWGAGESGQLGTGRCTRKEIPSEVVFEAEEKTAVKDIACGDGHTIAVLEDGRLYSWGLNHRGQCSRVDGKARHFPTLVDVGVKFAKLIADGHSCAAIDYKGELYTWGNANHGRLLVNVPQAIHEDPADAKKVNLSVLQPTRVESSALDGMEVEKFIFTKTSSAVLVKATLTKAWPLKGPKRNFSQLQILGFGLWDSPQILVKFASHVQSIYNPPRSTMGKLSADGTITCKPPKFAEVGWYSVSLSMDGGKEFFAQTFDIFVYKEPTILHQSPAVIDMRDKLIPSISLEVQGARDIAESMRVKLSLYRVKNEDPSSPSRFSSVSPGTTPSAAMAAHHARIPVAEFFVMARVVHDSAGAEPAVEIDHGDAMNTARTNDTNKRPGTAESTCRIVCEELPLEVDLASGLFDLCCQLSFNDQDFTGNSGKMEIQSSLCHMFQPIEAQPGSYAIKQLERLAALCHAQSEDSVDGDNSNLHEFERKIVVKGESFFPPSKLMKGAHIKAVVCGCRATDGQHYDEAQHLNIIESIDPLLVHCDTVDSMHFMLSSTCLIQLHAHMASMLPTPLGVQVDFLFELETTKSDGGTETMLLSPKPTSLFFYSDPKLIIDPVFCRRGSKAQSFEIQPAGSDGFMFNPVTAAVQVQFLNDVLPPLTLSGREVAIIPVYAPQEAGEHADAPNMETNSNDIGLSIIIDDDRTPIAFKLGFAVPAFSDLLARCASDQYPTAMTVSVALDGVCFSSPENAANVHLFSNLAKYSFQPALPKGGAPANSNVSLLLEEYCPAVAAEMVRVCLYGADEAAAVTLNAVMTETLLAGHPATTVQFTMPDQQTLTKIGVLQQGKEKFFHIGVSIDAGHIFDKPEKALLQVK